MVSDVCLEQSHINVPLFCYWSLLLKWENDEECINNKPTNWVNQCQERKGLYKSMSKNDCEYMIPKATFQILRVIKQECCLLHCSLQS